MRKNPTASISGLLLVAALVAAAIPDTGRTADSEADNIRFSWAFGAVIAGDGSRQLVNVDGGQGLNKNDQFKFKLTLKSRCYVYLIYHDGEGDVQLLFPRHLEQFDDDYQVSRDYFVPQGDLWFTLDGEGRLFLH